MDRITSITKVAIIAVTFPAVHKLTHDLEIADLVVTTAVDPVERAKHFLVVFVSVKVGAPLSRRDPPALAVRQPSKARSDFQEYEVPFTVRGTCWPFDLATVPFAVIAIYAMDFWRALNVIPGFFFFWLALACRSRRLC